MVEQNATKALKNTDRGYVIEMGRVRFDGESSALFDDQQVKELYLGG